MADKIPCGGFKIGNGLYVKDGYLETTEHRLAITGTVFLSINVDDQGAQSCFIAEVSDSEGNRYIDTSDPEQDAWLKAYMRKGNIQTIVTYFADDKSQVFYQGYAYVSDGGGNLFSVMGTTTGQLSKDVYIFKKNNSTADSDYVKLVKIGTLS